MIEQAQYYIARGFIVTEDQEYVFVTIKAPCPNIDNNRCMLHTQGRKPSVCRKYDCREDPHLPPGGNYEKGKERP